MIPGLRLHLEREPAVLPSRAVADPPHAGQLLVKTMTCLDLIVSITCCATDSAPLVRPVNSTPGASWQNRNWNSCPADDEYLLH
eukprot:3724609-Rhodomonas_salina.1